MMNPAAPTRIPQPDQAVQQVQRPDAQTFQQGQLSNDIVRLPHNEARPAAWCSAKGRVLATLVVWREPADAGDVVYALVKANLAQALVKRLAMFVLRAKVTLRVAARPVAGAILAAAPHDAAAWRVWCSDGQTRIQAPDADATRQRVWCIGSATDAPADAAAALTVSDWAASSAPAHLWHAADMAAGLPWIGAENQDLYIPQTLNLDLIGAISFTKGCYPGQEVVARSHYRGTIKRRMVYATAQAQAAIGMDVFQANGGESPCGRVINLADGGADGVQHLLLEVQLADLPDAALRLGRVDGATVTLQRLPYAI